MARRFRGGGLKFAGAGGATVAGQSFIEGELITRDALNAQKQGQILEAVKKGAFNNFKHAAAGIRKTAQASIIKSKEPAAPGQPVHTRRGIATSAIIFWASNEEALIGFNYSRVGPSMRVHEKGGRRKKTTYKPRPTMLPALEKNVDRFIRGWRHSVVS